MRKIATTLMAIMLLVGIFSIPTNVWAQDRSGAKHMTIMNERDGNLLTRSSASVQKFDLYNSDLLEAYNKTFKIEKIESIKNNGGNYSGSPIENAIDGNMKTHWETGRENKTDFMNAVEFTFTDVVELNRIIYAARQTGAVGKGFAQEFEIHGSVEATGDNYSLVSSGTYSGSISDIIEIKFSPTKVKRLKFVYKKANQNWASAAEFQFYKEDPLKDKLKRLFTDDTFSKVSTEFNSLEILNKLEQEVKGHPLYEQFMEEIDDAKVIVKNEKIESTTAKTAPFEYYTNGEYSKLFKMDNGNIKRIRNNGNYFGGAVIENVIDEDLNTYWETKTTNTKDFTNEVEVEFKKAVKINRLMYGARPSDLKGFAEQFEIYASKTSKGETYQLLSTGNHFMVPGLVEAKFKPTTIKRIKFKFKESNQNWATLSELVFYTEDPIKDKIDSLFTDKTMSVVSSNFNSLDKINTLENEAKLHPLYPDFKEQIELAKKIVKGEIETEGTIIIAEQRGDMKRHAQQNLRFNLGNNNQPTGLAALPGQTINVYVEAGSNAKLPSLLFSQQEGSWSNWGRTVKLVPGKNTIVVPEVPTDANYKTEITKGGPIYIVNPYTKEEQGKAPIIRFEGATRFPFMTENTNIEEFKRFLTTYKQKLDEDKVAHPDVKDRKLIDVVELVSEHLVTTGIATQAYDHYITNGNNPLNTIKGYDVWMKEFFESYGLDGRSELHDPKRIRENMRFMQPFAFMYAAGDHVGVQRNEAKTFFLDFNVSYPGWGLNHEIGHRMAINEREYVEITNNMVAMILSVNANNIDQRIPFEGEIYKNVIEENKKPVDNVPGFARLGAYWQLELAYPGYWAGLNSLYRERKVSLTNGDNSKQQYIIEFSSEVLGMDLSSYFARHGFTVNPETKAKVQKYPAPKKLWYLNNSVIGYTGIGFRTGTDFTINMKLSDDNKTNTLVFNMNNPYKQDLLGYEVYQDGKLLGFTSTDQFVVPNLNPGKNHVYEVIAYDKRLNTFGPVQATSQQSNLSIEEFVTLKLHQNYNPMEYVKAVDSSGTDVTGDVKITSNNIDVTKIGNYKVTYEVNNAGVNITKTSNVRVTDDYTYISDINEKSSLVGWKTLKKDLAPSDKPITLIRQGMDAIYPKGIGVHANSEVVYDIDGKDFDFFESYIGIDQAVKGQSSSATFEVWVDGQKKYTSGVFKADTEHQFVRISVTGAKEVKLVTTDAKNNSNTADHTVWAAAKFTQDSTNVGFDKSKLEKLIAEAKTYKKNDYTADTFNALQQALGTAEFVLANAITQEEIDQAAAQLQQAIDNLVKVTKPVLDTTKLEGLIAEAKTYKKNDFTADTFNALQQALGTAESVLANATTQEEIDNAVAQLQQAIDGLVKVTKPALDTTKLEGLIAEAKTYKKDDFTANSFNALQQALRIAESVLKNATTQDEIDQAVAQLQQAIDGLVKVTKPALDKSKLEGLIAEAKTYKQDDFTADTFNALQQALSAAESALANATTQAEIDNAVAQLQQAIDGLVKEMKPTLDKSKLEGLIAEAKTYKKDDFTEDTFNALQQVLGTVESVLANATTQAEIDQAVIQLQQAIDGLVKITKPGLDKSKLEGLIAQAKTYKKGDYTADSFNDLEQELGTAESVLTNATTQDEIDDEVAKLQQAIDSLVKETKPVLDTTKLEGLIAQAKTYKQGDFTADSFNTLQQALATAESALANATTQAEIDQAVAQLQQAIDGLVKEVKPVLDTTKLEGLIAQAKTYKKGDFTADSFNALQQALATAESALANATTQAEIDQAVAQLQQAIDGLVKETKPVLDTTKLEGLIAQAKTYKQSDFTADTFNALQQALATAESALANATTQEEIDNAVAQLKQAIDGLVRVKPENPGDQGKPENPGDQGKPENPGDQGKPENPGDQGKPENPGDQGKPENPGDQGKPENPGDQGTPGNPGDQGTPGNPGDQSKPENPSDQGKEDEEITILRPYIQGYPDGSFKPNTAVTRAQMATMLARYLTNGNIPTAEATFKDTQNNASKDAIEFVKQAGLFNGVTETTFDPNGVITRAQMASVVARWVDKVCVQDNTNVYCQKASSGKVFTDVLPSHWAAQAIEKVSALGIMTGISETTFNPNGSLTRAQAVKVLNKLFERPVAEDITVSKFNDVPSTHWAINDIESASTEITIK